MQQQEQQQARALYCNSWNSRHLFMCGALNFFPLIAFSEKKTETRNSRLKHRSLALLTIKEIADFFALFVFFLDFAICCYVLMLVLFLWLTQPHTGYIEVLIHRSEEIEMKWMHSEPALKEWKKSSQFSMAHGQPLKYVDDKSVRQNRVLFWMMIRFSFLWP